MVDPSDEPHSVAVKTRTLTKLPRHSTIHLKTVAQAKISFWFHLVDQMANGMWNTDPLVCKWARCLPSVRLLEADERVWALGERTCIKPFYWLWASDTCKFLYSGVRIRLTWLKSFTFDSLVLVDWRKKKAPRTSCYDYSVIMNQIIEPVSAEEDALVFEFTPFVWRV